MAETIYINAYRLLGLTKSATSSEIDDAFEKAAKQAKIKYVDKEETLKAVFAELRGARRILQDPDLRQKLNTQLTNQAKKSRKSSGFLSKSFSLLMMPIKLVFKLVFGNFFRFIVISGLLYGFFTSELTRDQRNTFLSSVQSVVGNSKYFNFSEYYGYHAQYCKKIRLQQKESDKLAEKLQKERYDNKMSDIYTALASGGISKFAQNHYKIKQDRAKTKKSEPKILNYKIKYLECFERNP